MNEQLRKHLVEMLTKTIQVLEKREDKDVFQLKELSEQTIKDASTHQDIDAVQIAIIIYSLYKVIKDFPEDDYQRLYKHLIKAKTNLQRKEFQRYNQNIKSIFSTIGTCNAKICKADRSKQYAQEVFHAARIKKGVSLFKYGLSIGRAAQIMGLSRWDLMNFIGKTKILEEFPEVSSKKRLSYALKIFS